MYQNIIDPKKNILNAFMAWHIKNHLNCIFQKRLDMISNKILSKSTCPTDSFTCPGHWIVGYVSWGLTFYLWNQTSSSPFQQLELFMENAIQKYHWQFIYYSLHQLPEQKHKIFWYDIFEANDMRSCLISFLKFAIGILLYQSWIPTSKRLGSLLLTQKLAKPALRLWYG